MKIFDYKTIKDRKWDKEVLNYIGLIHEFKRKQEFYIMQNKDELNTLVEVAIRQSTESSNKIEGIRTTNSRLRQLILDKTTPKNREKEIVGYRNVLNIIHDNYEYIPIKSNYILQLHKELYSYMDVGFGEKFKNTPNEIDLTIGDGSKICIFKPLEPFETPNAVDELCNEYNKAINIYNIDPLVLIPIFIHDFLCIHPFNDGNGRISRLLTSLLLYKSGYFIPKYISLEKKIQQTKNDYYDSLSASSNGWIENANDDTPFIKYLLSVILAAYRDFEDRVNITGVKQISKDMVLKAIDSKFGKFTKNDIVELCPKIKRATVERVLKELVEDNIITKVGNGKNTAYIRKN